jgi:uncharacterized protein
MKLSVIVHPNSKRQRIEKDLLGMIHVYVPEPPLEGKANKAVAELLVSHFKIKRNKIFLLSGEKSKNKLFEILEN